MIQAQILLPQMSVTMWNMSIMKREKTRLQWIAVLRHGNTSHLDEKINRFVWPSKKMKLGIWRKYLFIKLFLSSTTQKFSCAQHIYKGPLPEPGKVQFWLNTKHLPMWNFLFKLCSQSCFQSFNLIIHIFRKYTWAQTDTVKPTLLWVFTTA